MADSTPARIDRAALERIIKRAAELQTADRDIGDSLTPEQLLALGREVGIPDRHLQQALLEERTRLPSPETVGIWGRLVGPTEVAAQRVVPGDLERVERALVRWIEQHETLCIQRQQPGRVVWEPMRGLASAIRRSAAAVATTKHPFMLSRADTVSAGLLPLDSGRTHVTLVATATQLRSQLVGTGSILATMGVAGTGILVALGALLPVALLPLPVALAAGWLAARRYRPALERLRLGLERALDFLEQGATRPEHQLPPSAPGLVGLLAGELRKTLRPRT